MGWNYRILKLSACSSCHLAELTCFTRPDKGQGFLRFGSASGPRIYDARDMSQENLYIYVYIYIHDMLIYLVNLNNNVVYRVLPRAKTIRWVFLWIQCSCFIARTKKPMDQNDHRSDQIRYKTYGSLDWFVASSTVHFLLCLFMYLHITYTYLFILGMMIPSEAISLLQSRKSYRKIRLSIFIQPTPFSNRCRACRDLSQKTVVGHVCACVMGAPMGWRFLGCRTCLPYPTLKAGCFSTETPLHAFCASQNQSTYLYVCKMSMVFRRERYCRRNARREYQKSSIPFIVQMLG